MEDDQIFSKIIYSYLLFMNIYILKYIIIIFYK